MNGCSSRRNNDAVKFQVRFQFTGEPCTRPACLGIDVFRGSNQDPCARRDSDPLSGLIAAVHARLGTGKRFSRNAGLTSQHDDREKQCQSHNDFSFD
jgi:hypothetical protein